MVSKDSKRFKEFSKSCGNTYLAVRILSKWARELGEKFKEYRISESKLIETVLSGKCFYSEYQMLQRKAETDDDRIEDFLSWVLDDDIVEEVKYFYKLSINNKKLTRCTNIAFSDGKRGRINVLLKMIWYSTR